MKYIKPYQIFESSATAPAALTAVQIEWLDECVDGSWKLNRQTGLIDVDGNFDCSEQGLTDLKGVRFGKANWDFDCYYNQLTSLVGAPQTVDGDFSCGRNQLTSLEGAPKTVGGSFDCYDNKLTTLEGAPQSIKGDFLCYENQLTTLEGAPQKVGQYFHCYNNHLTTLEGAPQTVRWDFDCKDNQLTSLVGAPKTVGGDFYCEGNPVSETTLDSIFALMKKRKSYQQALEEYWPEMGEEDRVLMYKDKDHSSLSPEDIRKYKALATYNNIKNYL